MEQAIRANDSGLRASIMDALKDTMKDTMYDPIGVAIREVSAAGEDSACAFKVEVILKKEKRVAAAPPAGVPSAKKTASKPKPLPVAAAAAAAAQSKPKSAAAAPAAPAAAQPAAVSKSKSKSRSKSKPPPAAAADLSEYEAKVSRKLKIDASRQAFEHAVSSVGWLSGDLYGQRMRFEGQDVYVMAFVNGEVIVARVADKKLFGVNQASFQKV